MGKGIDKTWAILAKEYYVTLIRQEILTHVTTKISLKDRMLHEISQSPKDPYCREFHFHEALRAVRLIEMVEQGLGGRLS